MHNKAEKRNKKKIMTNIWNHEKRTISLRLRIASRSDYWSHSNWIIKHYGPWEIWLHLQRMPACFMDRVFLSHKFSSTSTFFTCCRQGLLPTELIFMSHQSIKIYIYQNSSNYSSYCLYPTFSSINYSSFCSSLRFLLLPLCCELLHYFPNGLSSFASPSPFAPSILHPR